jgi:serine/threonine-protein kinase
VDGSLKLMDFGIARILEKMRLTRSGHLIGTLEYMSPEQVQGRDVDARSDLYSLAVVLFELVTGRVPFAEGTDFEIMKAQIEAPPPPLRQLVGDVPPVLENILSRALAKDPAQRYPDASAFRSALEGVLANAAPVGDVAPRAVPATRMITPPSGTVTATNGSVVPPAAATEALGALPGQAIWKKYPGVVALVCALLVLGGLAWWSGSKTPAPPAEVRASPAHQPQASVPPAPPSPRSEPSPATALSGPAVGDPIPPASAPLSVPAAIPLPPPAPAARERVTERASSVSQEKVAAKSRAKAAPPQQPSVRTDPNPPVVKRDESGSAGGWTIRK